MKIRGKEKFETPRKVVTLKRATSGDDGAGEEMLQIRVRALPVGVDSKMFELFPEAPKPQQWAKNPEGVLIRDPDTKKTMIVDVETPEWTTANRKMTQLRMAYIIYHGIDDPNVDFEIEGQDKTKPEFYEGIWQKLIAFGFTMGDLGRLMSEITSLMNIADDIEVAKGN